MRNVLGDDRNDSERERQWRAAGSRAGGISDVFLGGARSAWDVHETAPHCPTMVWLTVSELSLERVHERSRSEQRFWVNQRDLSRQSRSQLSARSPPLAAGSLHRGRAHLALLAPLLRRLDTILECGPWFRRQCRVNRLQCPLLQPKSDRERDEDCVRPDLDATITCSCSPQTRSGP